MSASVPQARERIALVSSCVPLIDGGARFIVSWTAERLRAAGHLVEVYFVPTTDEPEHLLTQMAAFRMMDFERDFDRVITFRPPAHMVRHRKKVCWFIHHVRVLYDLWDSPYRILPDTARARALRDAVRRADTAALAEAHRLFANSRVVADRLRRFNGLDADVVFPPLQAPETFRSGPFGDEIVCVSRMEPHKRQHLLIEAMALVKSSVHLRLCGRASDPAYVERMRHRVKDLGLSGRVTIEDRWISEDEKAALLFRCLAAVYAPVDEDSYGYPTLEAAQAAKPIVTCLDSGGVLEFVRDGREGLVTAPEPAALARAFDWLHAERKAAFSMGEASRTRIADLGISWERVLERLLS